MKFWKKIYRIAMVIVATATLAACSNSKAKSTTKDESKTILIWSSSTGPDGQKIKTTIKNYNATKPKYKIKLVTMSGDTMNSKLATGGKSGKGLPDISMIASEQVKQFANQGLILPWDSYIKDSKVKASNYVKSSWDVGTVNGKQYGVPSDMGTWIMYYNKDLVNKYDPDALKDGVITYDEINKVGALAKKDNVYATANDWTMQNWSNIYMQLGGNLNAAGKVKIDNSYSIKALQILQEQYKNGYMVPKAQNAMKLFGNNKLVFLPEGTWMIGQLDELKDVNWGATFTPQVNADKIVNGSGAGQFVLMKTVPSASNAKKKGMTKFFSWLQTNQVEWLKSGVNSPSIPMRSNPEYKKMPQHFLIADQKAQDALVVVTKEGISYANNEIDARGWDMITGKADIKATFKTIQQVVDQKNGQ